MTSEAAPLANQPPEKDRCPGPKPPLQPHVEGFAKIRNGLNDHIKTGKLTPFDLGIYLYLHLNCTWMTGVYEGTALGIAYGFNDPELQKGIRKSLYRLRANKYINYREGDGKRGRYPILIHKYEPTSGGLVGFRLDAWKHGNLAKPEYEPVDSGETVERQSRDSRGPVEETVAGPIPDCTDSTNGKTGQTTTPRGWLEGRLTTILEKIPSAIRKKLTKKERAGIHALVVKHSPNGEPKVLLGFIAQFLYRPEGMDGVKFPVALFLDEADQHMSEVIEYLAPLAGLSPQDELKELLKLIADAEESLEARAKAVPVPENGRQVPEAVS